jgi:hypothetical protein
MRRLVPLLTAIAVLVPAPALLAAPSPSPGGVAVVPNAKSTHTNPARTAIRVGTLAVGRVFTETAEVANTTSAPVDLYVYPADGMPARGGGYAYATRGTKMTAVGAWLRVSAGRMTLPAHSRRAITLRLQVPATATNGLHVGAVVAEPVPKSNGPIITVTRYAMPVSLTSVGGVPPGTGASGNPSAAPTAAPSPRGGPIEVTDLKPNPRGSKVCPTVRVANNGGTVVRPRLGITSDGWFSGSSTTTTLEPVAPGTSRVVQLPCVKRPIGPGSLRVRVDDPQEEGYVGASLFWVPLVLWFSLLLLLLLIGALLTTFARGWLKRDEDEDAPNDPPPSHKELDGNHPQ